jgi:hypothetical protein
MALPLPRVTSPAHLCIVDLCLGDACELSAEGVKDWVGGGAHVPLPLPDLQEVTPGMHTQFGKV